MAQPGKLLNEGKTKIIYEINPDRAGHVLISSKDRITAGDGAKSDEMKGKAVVSNRTASMIFKYLNEVGIYNHFVEANDDRSFIARRCHMIPLEFVTRRLATGSFLKRNLGVHEGFVFAPPKLETFFKDDANHDPQWSYEQVVCAKLQYQTKKGLVVITKDKVNLMLELTGTIFEILERAWRSQDCTLVDMKIEFGVDDETGEIILADMIDSDSWRLWPHGDRKQMKDKQVYREIAKATAEDLVKVKTNFEWIADRLDEIFAHKINARAVIFMGSASDLEYAEKIAKEVRSFGIQAVLQVFSAHKTTAYTLEQAAEFEADGVPTVFVAVAGRSNGLGPVLSGNVVSPVINCPPPSDRITEDVWSSLRLPTGLGCTTVLSPDAAALAVANIIGLSDYRVWAQVKARLYNQKVTIVRANEKIQGAASK
ncbi:Multifunctional protein ADE2 [Hypsibius exemplaris]|uniref:Multifunctional protein ADE2 n=1 Tax=Hypsibius exemplaris TaxID=2072580 RepID=A0A9X6NC36_HYPEX|nr:Multifunctional protein ADE2 [Hypsibius exemplaris]